MKRKITLIDRFMNGKSIKQLAAHYKSTPGEIENVIRDELEKRPTDPGSAALRSMTDLSTMYLPKL